MKELIVYEFEGAKFTPVPGPDGKTWFIVAEVAKIIGHTDPSRLLRAADLDDDEKGTISIRTPGGEQEVLVVSEPGLYSLLLTSRKRDAKAIAKRFRRYVTHNVLPAIRERGFYVDENRLDEMPPVIREAYLKFKAVVGREPRGGLMVGKEVSIEREGTSDYEAFQRETQRLKLVGR